MKLLRNTLFLLLLANIAKAADSTDTNVPVSINEKTANMERHDGFFNYYWDASEGKIWLEVNNLETEFLYINSLPHGVGSNALGLDRGQLDDRRVVFFRRVGPKLLLIQPNYSFRSLGENVDEQKAVENSFAFSTLYGFKIEAESDERLIVDATSFFLRDARHVARTLRRAKQGSFKLEPSRSVIYLDETVNFPQNTEISAMLTFTADSAGALVRAVTPTPEILSVIQRHSFIALPDDDYRPRLFDLRSGFFGISFMDFATPIEKPIRKRFIARHRLKKRQPRADVSEAIKPIIYYVDRGAPEPIRSALMEGASWWNEAFEAAGFKNAFQVKLLPEGADPMDIRYNIIQWVHRSSRGWSYGDAVTDPRTGEILKGHITLGSLRARQDFLIAEGLLGPYTDPESTSSEMLEMVLARIRQLACHEVGHTLGLRHNFAASTNDRASVMDYPYPFVQIKDGRVDLSEAYDNGIGEWDKAAIIYGYKEFPNSSDESTELAKHLNDVYASGLKYFTDADARSLGSANRWAHLWDNGDDPVDELNRLMKVRHTLLSNFSQNNLAFGRPMAMLEETLVPIYMFHRYQLEAASKVIGGLYYEYSLRDSRPLPQTAIHAAKQRSALDALLATITPEALMIPDAVRALLPPHTTGYGRPGESFARRTGPTFDPLSAAESSANLTLRLIFQPQRAARLVEQHAIDSDLPSLDEIIEETIAATWKKKHNEKYEGEIQRLVDNLLLRHLTSLAISKTASSQVRAIAYAKIDELKEWIAKQDKKTMANKNPGQHAHLLYAASQIELFQRDPDKFQISPPVSTPSGSPIGTIEIADGRLGCDWR